jgi:prefoldin alpha subunit
VVCALCPCVDTADQPLMLPLTGSLYVKGKVADTQHLLVNIGTDYYVEVGGAVAPVR